MARGRGGGGGGGGGVGGPGGVGGFSLQQVTISEQFELESSDWAHFLRLFELELKISQRL
jgi:hypothetical protein